MRILRVKANNLKGRTFDHTLAPVTIIQGPSASGKSAILAAIRLALLGSMRLPIGKRADRLYRLASNPASQGELRVEVEYPDGLSTGCAWRKDNQGKVSYNRWGVIPKVEPVMLDAREFTEGSAAEQVALLAKAIDFPNSKLLEGLNNIPDTGNVLDRIRTYAANHDSLPTFEFYDQLRSWMQNTARAASHDEELYRSLAPPLEEEPPDVTTQLAEAEAQLKELNARMTAIKEAERTINELKATFRFHLERECSSAEDIRTMFEMPAQMPKIKADIKKLENAIEVFNSESLYLRTALKQLEAGKPCPVCKTTYQPTAQSERAARQTAYESVAEANLKVQAARYELEKLRETENKLMALAGSIAIISMRIGNGKTKIDPVALWEQLQQTASGPSVSSEEIASLKSHISDLQAKAAARKAYLARVAKRNEIVLKQGEAANTARVLKEAIRLIEKNANTEFSERITLLLARASLVTSGLLTSPLVLQNREIGRIISQADVALGSSAPLDAWVPLDAFSDSEQIIAQAGLSLALATTSEIKLIIVDELGRMSQDLKQRFVERMVKLTQDGIIDQFIGAEPTYQQYPSVKDADALRIIQLRPTL